MKRITACLLILMLLLSVTLLTSCKEGEDELPVNDFFYSVTSVGTVFHVGMELSVTVTVQNNGQRFAYVGAAEELFTATYAMNEGKDYILKPEPNEASDDTETHYLETGATVSRTFVFRTSETTPTGFYSISFKFAGIEDKALTKAFVLLGNGSSTTDPAAGGGTEDPSESTAEADVSGTSDAET